MDFKDFETEDYQEYQELGEFGELEGPEEPRRDFFGLSPVEIGILVVLIVIICVLAGFVAKSFYDNSRVAAETPTPTATITPTVPAVVTSTPWPTAAAIPDWNKFEFAGAQASLWLPNSFQGGDPLEYPEIVRMIVETYSNDEVFIQSVDEVLSENTDISLFAFDPEFITYTRIVVTSQEIHPDLILNMDAYLDDFRLNVEAEGDRVVGREIVPLDHFQAGRIIYEFKTPIGDAGQYTYDKTVIYLVPVDDTLWQIEYRTDRSDFPDFWPIIQESISTFHALP